MDAGNLVGDDVMIGIVGERLDRPDARARASCSTASRARSAQATALDGMIDGRGPLVVLDIVVPEDVLVRRLATRRICGSCGVNAAGRVDGACQNCGGELVARIDDGVEIVRERLKVYQRQTRAAGRVLLGAADVPVDRRQPAARRRDARRIGDRAASSACRRRAAL